MRIFFKYFSKIQANLYKATGGSLGGSMAGMKLLILTTKGRKSGKKYHTPLAYVMDGTNHVVTASAGGASNNPDWFKNLEADPVVEVNIKGKRYKAKAIITQGKQRDMLWRKFIKLADMFGKYEKKAGRIIPVVILERKKA